MGFVGHTRGEGSGFASFDGDGIDVAHEVKSDGFSIGTYVKAHPGAFSCGEVYLTLRLEGKVFEFGIILDRVFFGAIRLNGLGT